MELVLVKEQGGYGWTMLNAQEMRRNYQTALLVPVM